MFDNPTNSLYICIYTYEIEHNLEVYTISDNDKLLDWFQFANHGLLGLYQIFHLLGQISDFRNIIFETKIVIKFIVNDSTSKYCVAL